MLIYFILLFSYCSALPESGHKKLLFNQGSQAQIIAKSMFKGSFFNLKVNCESAKAFNATMTIHSRILPCLNRNGAEKEVNVFGSGPFKTTVDIVCYDKQFDIVTRFRNEADKEGLFVNGSKEVGPLETAKSGIYSFIFSLELMEGNNVTVEVDLKSSYGYLSAMEWPLLVFYSVMCGLYSLLALAWLLLACRNWRDLLRLQIWIGAVIFLGMLEKALFVAEYEQVNKTGQPLNYPVLVAEVVSCVKRALARVLIMIVCIGYGIVKPRLGPAMKKILGVGLVYLAAALVESFMRVLQVDVGHGGATSNYLLVPNIALVITDSLIMWWSFSYLIQTIRDMRQRRNIVKFNLYRHFSNILIIVVVASVLFMSWFLYTFKSSKCVTSWNEVWVNTAFWHVLFSVVLTTIMVLWRPSKNSQRYAYSPLLDEESLDADDDDEESVTMDNLTTGELRKPNQDGREKKAASAERKTAEDDLRWIEENIPASAAEKIYPVVDSEEELTVSKITSGKMD